MSSKRSIAATRVLYNMNLNNNKYFKFPPQLIFAHEQSQYYILINDWQMAAVKDNLEKIHKELKGEKRLTAIEEEMPGFSNRFPDYP